MKKTLFALTVILSCLLSAAAQRTGFFVAPQATDPQIDRALQNHYVAVNSSVAPKNRLFLFFAGTGGVPFNYLEINNTAADAGFHAIALSYPNDEAVNQLCGAPNTNLDCYANVRLEIKDGTDRTALVDVNRPNALENRLIKLLGYLRTQHPTENWEQFLINGSTINWTRIVVAGHSQGGGHAAIIGRFHPVARVIMLAAMDFNGLSNAPANWIARPETTPNASTPDKFWGFSHMRDEQVNFTLLSNRIWSIYGMPSFGSIVNVDNTAPPYNNTHSLTSNGECDNFHGCIAVDVRLVRDGNGAPVYKPVWQYLLANPPAPFGLVSLKFARGASIVTRPPVGTTTKNHKIILEGGGFDPNTEALINGIEADTEFISENEIRVKIPAGRFGSAAGSAVRIRAASGQLSNFLTY
jgi:hypothetical protein